MKKILFNDKYGLTKAVLEGRKTMTRRIIGQCDEIESHIDNGGHCLCEIYTKGIYAGTVKSKYKVGEVVAIAQRYSVLNEKRLLMDDSSFSLSRSKGWNNKMNVKADLMPHRIRITDIKVERLQDISEEDCLKEGVFMYDNPPLHHESDMYAPWPPYVKPYKYNNDNLKYFCEARYAFAYLIDKVSGRGTFERNPWVFAYTFELIR